MIYVYRCKYIYDLYSLVFFAAELSFVNNIPHDFRRIYKLDINMLKCTYLYVHVCMYTCAWTQTQKTKMNNDNNKTEKNFIINITNLNKATAKPFRTAIPLMKRHLMEDFTIHDWNSRRRATRFQQYYFLTPVFFLILAPNLSFLLSFIYSFLAFFLFSFFSFSSSSFYLPFLLLFSSYYSSSSFSPPPLPSLFPFSLLPHLLYLLPFIHIFYSLIRYDNPNSSQLLIKVKRKMWEKRL